MFQFFFGDVCTRLNGLKEVVQAYQQAALVPTDMTLNPKNFQEMERVLGDCDFICRMLPLPHVEYQIAAVRQSIEDGANSAKALHPMLQTLYSRTRHDLNNVVQFSSRKKRCRISINPTCSARR